MYTNDIKLFAKNEKRTGTLIHAVRIYSPDIGMEFGIEKCATLGMKSGKRHLSDGMELPNQDKITTLAQKENVQILGHHGRWRHQTSGDERKTPRKSI